MSLTCKQMKYDSDGPTLEISSKDTSTNYIMDFNSDDNDNSNLFREVITVFDDLNAYIEDHESCHPSTYNTKHSSFVAKIQGLVKTKQTLSFYYGPLSRVLTIEVVFYFGKILIEIDLDHEKSWSTWLEIRKQMKRDYNKLHRNQPRLVYKIENTSMNDTTSSSSASNVGNSVNNSVVINDSIFDKFDTSETSESCDSF